MQDKSNILAWELVAEAVLANSCRLEQLAWIDRTIQDAPDSLQDWIDYRNYAQKYDTEDVGARTTREAIEDVQQSRLWQNLAERGFRRTWVELGQDEYGGSSKSLATVIYSPSLLEQLDAERSDQWIS